MGLAAAAKHAVKRDSVYRTVDVPNISYGHELQVITERTMPRIQEAKISFLHMVAGLSLKDRVGVEVLLLHVKIVLGI